MDVLIRSMGYGDLKDIVEIERLCFSMPWSVESFEKELVNPLACYICAETGGQVVGYVGVWRILDEGHITNVAVRPEHRGRGIGSLLVARILEVCRTQGISSVTLEVRESNSAAIGLYEKHGFRKSGKRPGYYQKPKEAAVIMWNTLTVM